MKQWVIVGGAPITGIWFMYLAFLLMKLDYLFLTKSPLKGLSLVVTSEQDLTPKHAL
jgi:hypothetical protein